MFFPLSSVTHRSTVFCSRNLIYINRNSYTWARREVFGVPVKTPIYSPLHMIVSFCNNPELIHVFNVDKNGGKISEFRFLQKVLKLDFPKVYFFGSLKKSLLPINENPKIAAIFTKSNWNVLICSTCQRYMPRCFAPRRAEGPTVKGPKGRPSKGRRAVLSQSYNTNLIVVIYCTIICSNSL
jgi:hypothetical protein